MNDEHTCEGINERWLKVLKATIGGETNWIVDWQDDFLIVYYCPYCGKKLE